MLPRSYWKRTRLLESRTPQPIDRRREAFRRRALGLVTALLTGLSFLMVAESADFQRATLEGLDLLIVLVRQDTTNPPGNEVLAARPLAVFFSDKGIGCELIEPEPGRGNLLCRLKGEGTSRPLLLVTHLDTAGVNSSRWSVPPFSGRLRDDHIYGRGVLGGKGATAAAAEALALLARQGSLARDIIFLATADGESSGEHGLKWLLENRPELLEAEMALSTGGQLLEVDGKITAAAVQIEEGSSPASVPLTEASLPQAIRRALERLAPGARVEGQAGPGAANARLLRRSGVPTCGLSPFPLGEEEVPLVAGAEERLGLKSFSFGIRLIYAVLWEAAVR